MTPYERIVVAIRHGVLVKRKATMRYSADVRHLSNHPYNDDEFTVVPIEASTAGEAAGHAAAIAAERKYGSGGCTGWMHRTGPDSLFAAAIGVQEYREGQCVLRGMTVSIRIKALD